MNTPLIILLMFIALLLGAGIWLNLWLENYYMKRDIEERERMIQEGQLIYQQEIDSLKAQLVEAEELGKANVHWKQKEIDKLEAQLSKSQERVKELEDEIEGLNEDEFGRKL